MPNSTSVAPGPLISVLSPDENEYDRFAIMARAYLETLWPEVRARNKLPID